MVRAAAGDDAFSECLWRDMDQIMRSKPHHPPSFTQWGILLFVEDQRNCCEDLMCWSLLAKRSHRPVIDFSAAHVLCAIISTVTGTTTTGATRYADGNKLMLESIQHNLEQKNESR